MSIGYSIMDSFVCVCFPLTNRNIRMVQNFAAKLSLGEAWWTPKQLLLYEVKSLDLFFSQKLSGELLSERDSSKLQLFISWHAYRFSPLTPTPYRQKFRNVDVTLVQGSSIIFIILLVKRRKTKDEYWNIIYKHNKQTQL